MRTPVRPLNLLFATWEGGGCVPPVIEAARLMLDRGHRVRVMSDACNRPEIEAAGARFVAWTKAPCRRDKTRESDLLRDWEAAGPEGLLRLLDEIIAGPALAYARDIANELDLEAADLVASLDMLLGVLAACEQRGQPAVAFGAGICVLPLEGAPPFGGGALPAEDEAGKAALARGAAQLRALFDSRLPALNAARRALGLRPLDALADQVRSARGLLLATSEAFDFPWTSRPDFVRYVGGRLTDPPWSGEWVSPWPASDSRPLVLVGFSTTFQDHAGVLQRVLDGLADLPVRVLLTCGDALTPSDVRAPSNAMVVQRAPHAKVMAEAAIVVTHGGHGTVIRALAAGLPLLVIPHGRDQVDNAARVVSRGAGLCLGADASEQDIRAAAWRLLAEPRFAAASARLGLIVRRDSASPALVEALESAALVPAVVS